jgi:hypothetical protein
MIAAACRSWLKHLFCVVAWEPRCWRSRTWTLCLEPLEDRTLLSTFFVVNAGDSGAGCANHGDLRYCITQSNATPGPNIIAFALPGTGVQTIHLQSALPALTHCVILDGWSQGGTNYTGAPLVELDGSAVSNDSGLTLQASDCVVRGLAINGFGGYGLVVGGSSANDWVYGCSFGVTSDGLHAAPNADGGVFLGGTNTLLGTNADGVHDTADRNLISGNNGNGVVVAGCGNTVDGDIIGLGADGATPLGNAGAGVLVLGANNTIGAAAPGAGDVISANLGSGIQIEGASATGNVVQGDNIGTDASGMSARGNTGDGIVVTDGACDNAIGGSVAADRNVISGNDAAGVALGRITAAGADNRVLGNYIGINAAGTAVLGNGFEGVLVNDSSSGEVIGGCDPGDGNVISGNGLFGLNIINASKNTVQGNFIGTLPDGDTAAPNALGGVALQSTTRATKENLIGGTTAGAGNLISGNTGPGILLTGSGVTGNRITGNRIGTTAAGDAPLGNAGDGIRLDAGASNNIIGGETPDSGNLIAFNAKGVVVAGEDSTGDSILGNSIFGNAGLGIDLGDDGVTPNGTPPPGPNNFQPYPVLLSANNGQVAGYLSAAANTTYRIELFSSPASGPARQGQTFLGVILVTTGANGFASFTAKVPLLGGEVVTATATNTVTGDTSEFSAGPPASVVAVSGSGQYATVDTSFDDPLQVIVRDAYGDPLPGILVTFAPPSGSDGSFSGAVHTVTNAAGVAVSPLFHAGTLAGSYTISATVEGLAEAAVFSLEVYNAGVDLTQIKQATEDSPTIRDRGVTATLYTASATESLLLAPVSPNEVEQLGGAFQAGLGTFVSAYDFRSVDPTTQDKVVVIFQFPPGQGTPALEYFDSSTQSFKPILGSTLQPNSLVIDSVHGTIRLILDESSTPRIADLTGTVFVVSIPQAQLSPLAVSPPPSPLPSPQPVVSPPLSALPASVSSGATEATTGTATFSSLSTTVLPSGTTIPIPPANTQTVSNNSSVSQISAFSPFVLMFTALYSGTPGGEANAEAEGSRSLASPPDVLSLLNRLPHAPASEDSFTPPDSGPRGVLSPSRAGFPEGADGAEAPGQAPAPIPTPPRNNLPPVGLRVRPTGHETTNEHETRPDEDRFEGATWLDEALSDLLRRLTWHENGFEGEDVPVHPAVAVLILGAGFVSRAAQRTMPLSRSRVRSGID